MKSKNFKNQVKEIAKKIGVVPKEIHMRSMSNKWASCSSKGRLTFEKELLEMEDKRRDEIVVHELLHLRYRNHGKMFKRLKNMYLRQLKKLGNQLGMGR